MYNIERHIYCILYNTYNIYCTILCTLFLLYCTYCTYCTYCAKGSNFVRIVHYCTLLYVILCKIVFCCCVQNCTLLYGITYKIVHCPAPAGAVPACCRGAWPGWFPCLCCFAPSLLPPRAGSVAMLCPSKSLRRALLFRITGATTYAVTLRAAGHRQQRQRRRPMHDRRRRWSSERLGLELTWRVGIIHDCICLVPRLLGLEHLTKSIQAVSLPATHEHSVRIIIINHE